MGTMPFHLEKGVLGLRMDYLARSPAVRTHVVQRLQAGENPFAVAASINITGVGVVNVFNDDKRDFIAKLDLLNHVDPTPADPHRRRSGQQYWDDQRKHLMPANNDNTGNRNAFSNYWVPHQAAVAPQLTQALMGALTSGREHIDHWWDCSLPDGATPMIVLCLESPGAARILFVTDHGPVQPDSTGIRDPQDEDPIFAA